MLTQKEFVEGCIEYNRENGFVQVGSEPGYQDAHYPRPRGLGSETIPLTFNQHQIQGLLQSEEEGRVCFFAGDVKAFLDGDGFLCPDWFDLYNTYDKWVIEWGKKTAELGIGCHEAGKQSEWGKKGATIGGKKAAELGVGCHAPGMSSKGGKKAVEMGVGIHAPGMASKAARRAVELGVGAHGRSPEQKVEDGKKGGKKGGKTVSSQKWICLVTGKVSNPGNIARYQKARGIPTHLRSKLDGTDLVSQTMLLGMTAL